MSVRGVRYGLPNLITAVTGHMTVVIQHLVSTKMAE